MESLWTTSTVPTQSNSHATRGYLRPSSLLLGQQGAVQLQQQGRMCNFGRAFKKLRLQHSSPRASIRVTHSTLLSRFLCLRANTGNAIEVKAKIRMNVCAA